MNVGGHYFLDTYSLNDIHLLEKTRANMRSLNHSRGIAIIQAWSSNLAPSIYYSTLLIINVIQ